MTWRCISVRLYWPGDTGAPGRPVGFALVGPCGARVYAVSDGGGGGGESGGGWGQRGSGSGSRGAGSGSKGGGRGGGGDAGLGPAHVDIIVRPGGPDATGALLATDQVPAAESLPAASKAGASNRSLSGST